MATISIEGLRARIARFPKQNLIQAPTPFYRLEILSRLLGGPDIYIKREDLTGLAFGGNKSRKLEFILQDMVDQGADAIVTWAGFQSNWCLQTAAAARRFGIKPVLLLFGPDDPPELPDGNLLLDALLDADIRFRRAAKGKVVKRETVQRDVDEVVAELRAEGHRPYVAPIGGSAVGGSMSRPLGAIGYASSYAEMALQAEAAGIRVDYIVHSSGSGGTQAGLLAGAKAVSDHTRVLGISVSDGREPFGKEVFSIAVETAEALELNVTITGADVTIFDDYLGAGYGIVDQRVTDALRIVAKSEGIFLDPVYTGKAMVGLMDLIRKGYFHKQDKVVFFHTGGTAAIFPYRHSLVERPAAPGVEKSEPQS